MVAAVGVVAQVVFDLRRKLAPDRQRATLMVAAAMLVLLGHRAWAQVLTLVKGGLLDYCALSPLGLELSLHKRLVFPLQLSLAIGCLYLPCCYLRPFRGVPMRRGLQWRSR